MSRTQSLRFDWQSSLIVRVLSNCRTMRLTEISVRRCRVSRIWKDGPDAQLKGYELTDHLLPDLRVLKDHLSEAAAAQESLVAGGRMAYGVFHRRTSVALHDHDSPFRIASMTKSFTAAAIGLIAANGIDLDMPIGRLVPDLIGTSVADRTCRQALTMGTGFTKDDPWADRMEAMTAFELTAHLQRGAIPIAPADTGFEYSNLGYALLGLVAESVTGKSFIDIVTAEVIDPLRLTRTGFDYADFPDLVPGIRIDRHGRAHPTELTGPGAFSPIGGVISTVRDVAAWMTAHMDCLVQTDTYKPGSWSRILADNQQAHRLVEVQRSEHHAESVHYGYGLMHRLDSRFGRVICHSGGYPGYGSHMRWFPDIDLSIVVLGNTTYFPAERVVRDAIDAAWAAAVGTPGLELSRTTTVAPVPYYFAQEEQSETVLRAANLVIDFDDVIADELFSVNMDLDVPRSERREHFAEWRREQQLIEPFIVEDLTMTTPLRGTVTVPGNFVLLGEDSAEPLPPSTITVSLNHLGEVQTISLSS